LVLSLVATACTNESSDASTAADTETTTATAGKVEGGERESSPRAQVAQSSGSASADAYQALLGEIRALEQTATTMQKRAQALDKIENLFLGFIKDFPDAPEALDARFQWGILYVSLTNMKEAAKTLDIFVREAGKDQVDKLAYAHFYLAEAYKGSDDFENAKKNYQIFLDEYAQVNPKLTSAARMGLEDLTALKQLRIGGDPIPFEVTDLDGKTLSLEKLKGKVVLIDFWATWCGPCKVEMPNVIKLHKKYNEKGFEIVGISLDRDKAALENYIRTNKMEWPQHFDGAGWQNGVATKYKVRSIPATYLIDRKGKIRYRSLRGTALEEAVAELVDESV
jgi:thiol-disulfide isomerase/thioredoxin